ENTLIIEPGSGSSEKIELLLNEISKPFGYMPIEISRSFLLESVSELQNNFPKLNIFPIWADFVQDFTWPEIVEADSIKKMIFFPGSTIGNFNPEEALNFLKKYGKLVGPDGGLLIGVDLKKNEQAFKLAYDDPQGVTARFNLNLLERVNRET